jgi:hypothetical protein
MVAVKAEASVTAVVAVIEAPLLILNVSNEIAPLPPIVFPLPVKV